MLRRLARREHVLVERALSALTDLESLTDDPDLLARIYELDHLVTRVRRQVENTAVLGGQSLRGVRRPVTVMTVLRGAASEVVQYPRVAVVAESVGTELGLPGHVGPDLTHLLAELIENGCQFSDPTTRVTVRARRVVNGLLVEVEDMAVAIRPATRDQLNAMLRSPDEVDVSAQVRAGQIGLLTASKIAQVHEISVRLTENPTGGTTAQVVVPARQLVVLPPPEAPSAEQLVPAVQPPRPHASMAERYQSPQAAPPPRSAVLPMSDSAPAPPLLPQRAPVRMPSQAPRERPAAPTAPARTDLAAAFRSGMHSGQDAGAGSDRT
jgi:hypothetical protein